MGHAHNNLSTIICDLVESYISEWDNQVLTTGEIYKCNSAYDINNGLCGNFAEDLIKLLGGENNSQFILSDDMFLNNFYSEATELWGKEDLIKTKDGAAWSKKMLTVYSIPPVDDIRLVEYLPQHIWVFIDNKHYDAENPNGVNSPWELLIFKKYFKSLN
jgi:hypothetical protein